MREKAKTWIALLILVAGTGLNAMAGSGPAQPKLVVAILIDQFRYDYLERFADQFSTNGFRLFLDRGAFMTFAHYNYVPTLTGPGHASFMSGSTPMVHGIISNDWFDRKTGKEVYCAEDQSVDGVGTTTAGGRFSPKNFIGDNFADELRLRFRSKVIAVSMKDRAAIFPGGKKPAGAFWFHGKNGNFVTSTYYMQELPNWVRQFNARKRPDSFMGQSWTRLLDKKDYQYPDAGAGEGTLAGEKSSKFDHVVAAGNYDNILPTPFGNQLLEEFAEAAVQGEDLGSGQQPDFLSVSFSSIDYIGHRFGPYSQEVQDGVVRLDRQLEKFFNFLDQKIGLENVMITLTADHAVAPVPEFGREQGLDEQRLSESDFLADLKNKLEERFGNGSYFLSSKLYGGNLYLNRDLLERKQLKFADVAAVLRDAAYASGKVQACYSRDELLEGRVRGPFGLLALNGYNAERGGDMLILFKPYLVPGSGKTGTTHGSAFAYDTHIPILFFGSAFKPGRYADDFHITDIVPALCAALHMNEPAGCMGKPLPRMLAGQ